MKNIKVYFELLKQFGLRYAFFRIKYELLKKTGILKNKFSTKLINSKLPSLNEWREKYRDTFIFSDRETIPQFSEIGNSDLNEIVDNIKSGEILFFSQEWKKLGFEKEWNTHPITGYVYPESHWTELPIYDANIGDIKYVWEKSKFSYLLYVIRGDHHNNNDSSQFVFKEIVSWIDANPPNIGPQYICSQEISIRLLNWSFALFYYKNSEHLTDEVFNKIMKSLEIQFEHIYRNIFFSKIAVRNNHAVTETLALYLIGLYFPFLKNASKYKRLGKRWFENEILYQLFEDGSDSQYSFNYHRVKIQLLTWALASAKANNETFNEVVYSRAKSSLDFLLSVMANKDEGLLPNFGPNDGSIYFKLNQSDFRNYLPQLFALSEVLGHSFPVEIKDPAVKEDAFWFTQKFENGSSQTIINSDKQIFNYADGGHFLIKDNETLTYFKSGKITFRAAQDDLLHLDLWYKGINFLRDSGSFSYNTDLSTLMSFNGVKGHNSPCLNGENRMEKGPRFTWLYKPEVLDETCEDLEDRIEINSSIRAFFPTTYIINRKLVKFKDKLVWEIHDEILKKNSDDDFIHQYWNLAENLPYEVSIQAINDAIYEEDVSWFSPYYGLKEKGKKIIFKSSNLKIKTRISIQL